jgi:hypothetical protein
MPGAWTATLAASAAAEGGTLGSTNIGSISYVFGYWETRRNSPVTATAQITTSIPPPFYVCLPGAETPRRPIRAVLTSTISPVRFTSFFKRRLRPCPPKGRRMVRRHDPFLTGRIVPPLGLEAEKWKSPT